MRLRRKLVRFIPNIPPINRPSTPGPTHPLRIKVVIRSLSKNLTFKTPIRHTNPRRTRNIRHSPHKLRTLTPPVKPNVPRQQQRITRPDVNKQNTLVVKLLNLFLRKIPRSEEHTSELQSRGQLVCRLL